MKVKAKDLIRALCVTTLLGGASHGDPSNYIYYQFTGEVDSVEATAPASFEVGQSVFGYFILDSSKFTVPPFANATFRRYQGLNLIARIDDSYLVQGDEFGFGVTTAVIGGTQEVGFDITTLGGSADGLNYTALTGYEEEGFVPHRFDANFDVPPGTLADLSPPPTPAVISPSAFIRLTLRKDEVLGDIDADLIIKSLTLTRFPNSIDQYNTTISSAAPGLSEEDRAPEATPFGDGVENLLKYAFNMNLSGPDRSRMAPGGASGLPTFRIEDTGGGPMWRSEYVRKIGSGIVYTPMVGSSLDDFQEMVGTTTVEPIDDEWERVVVEQPCDVATTPRCFGKVRVALP